MPDVVLYRVVRDMPFGIRLVLNKRYEKGILGRVYRYIAGCDWTHFQSTGTLRRDMDWLKLFFGFSKNL